MHTSASRKQTRSRQSPCHSSAFPITTFSAMMYPIQVQDHAKTIGLLALLVALHYGYHLAAPGDRADWWNIAGAVARSALLIALAWRWRGPVLLVVAWWLAEEAMVAGCSVAFIFGPWDVPEGQDQCSAILGLDIGKLTAAGLLGLLVWVTRGR